MSKKSDKLPALQFYPGDWKKDPGVSMLDIAARGVWLELLLIMHESEDRGVLLINGQIPTEPQLALAVRCSLKQFRRALSDILRLGVADRLPSGALVSRRMVKDEKTRNRCKDAGSLGGNPKLVNPDVTPRVIRIQTPSSSSSISSSDQKEKEKEPDPNLHPSPDAPAHLTRKPYELKPYPSPNTNCFLGDIDVTALKLHFAGSELRLFYFVAEIDRLSQASPKKWRKYVNHRATILSWDRLKTERGLVWVEHPTDGQRAGFYPHYVATKIGHEAH